MCIYLWDLEVYLLRLLSYFGDVMELKRGVSYSLLVLAAHHSD